VEYAFKALPLLYDLLTTGANPVLGRYDVQIANGIFADVADDFIAARTQFEMAEKIAEQLTLMVPENAGDDAPEDPEYSLFASAYLTDAFIRNYDLKGYHFMVTDAPSHGRIDNKNLIRVFGEEVYEKVTGNGFDLNKKNLPDTETIVKALKSYWHAFAIIIKNNRTADYWRKHYGTENVVLIDSAHELPFVQAAIIGLTEGVIDLQGVADYLVSAGCDRGMARRLADAVSVIPVGAQVMSENFAKIPPKGKVYANKRDMWPVEDAEIKSEKEAPSKWL
jgi:hypothetical protein